MKKKINSYLGQLLALALLFIVVACNPSSKKALDSSTMLPNIVIFLTDDLGYGDLGCYGNPIIKSPNIDKLASEGIRFTDMHSAGTVCSPSRASLLTGRHPYRLGFYYILGGGAHLTADEVTLPTLLKQRGYETFFAGKWHLTRFDRPQLNQPDPKDHGFDHWFATVVNAFDGPESPAGFYRNGHPVGELNDWYCNVIVDEAIDWIQNRDGQSKPFFMEICTHGPHTPINPPKEYVKVYETEEVEKLENTIAYGQVPRPEKDIEPLKQEYYGTVTQIDEAFGRLMVMLDEQDLRDNTMIIFTSDNGPEYPVNLMESRGEWDDPIRDKCFGTPGPLRGMKRFTYEGGHRVPGIISWPGTLPDNQVSDALVNGTDFLPTICNLLNIPLPDGKTIDGENVWQAFQGKRLKRQQAVVWNTPVHEYEFVPPMTLRDGDYVLVAWFNKKPSEQLWMDWIKSANPISYELYDLSEDIGQQQDISDQNQKVVERLSKKMEQIWQDIQEESPVLKQWKAK